MPGADHILILDHNHHDDENVKAKKHKDKKQTKQRIKEKGKKTPGADHILILDHRHDHHHRQDHHHRHDDDEKPNKPKDNNNKDKKITKKREK